MQTECDPLSELREKLQSDEVYATRARILGMRIQMARKLMKLTQYEFAHVLKTNHMRVSRWENGSYPPSTVELMQISDVTEKPTQWYYEQ